MRQEVTVSGLQAAFQLHFDWWIYILRATVVYFGVLLLLRIAGKRRLGKFTPFDMALLLLIGGAGARVLTAEDHSLTAAGIVILTMLALNTALGIVTARWGRLEHTLEGWPVVLIQHGRVDYKALRRESITINDLLAAIRESGCMRPSQVDYAVLETNGRITVNKCPAESAKPLKPLLAGGGNERRKSAFQS
jgi:uncharacterized membrane protein YcaP (DUF421 family)